jgi:VanZ family protein
VNASWVSPVARIFIFVLATAVLLLAILNAPSQHQSAVLGTGAVNDAIRKTGHILGYGTLAVLVALAIGAVRVRGGAGILRAATVRWVLLVAWAAAAVVAAADELHQSFVPDRTSSWLDVALDIAAAAAGLALLVLWSRRRAARGAGEPPGA